MAYLTKAYINPTFAINGNGTLMTEAATPGGAGAFNAWGTGTTTGVGDLTHFWCHNRQYMQCAETDYPVGIVVYPVHSIYIGTYDPATGNAIQDNTRHASVTRSTIGIVLDIGSISASRYDVTVDNMDLISLTREDTSSFAITFSAVPVTMYAGVVVRRCTLDGYKAVASSGTHNVVDQCVLGGYRGRVAVNSTWIEVTNCTILDLPIDVVHDMIALNALTVDPVEWVFIANNDLRKTIPTWKQGIYLYSGGATNRASIGPVIIQNNYVNNAQQLILTWVDNTIIRGNHLSVCYDPTSVDPLQSSARAITLNGKNSLIEFNNFSDMPLAMCVALPSISGSVDTIRNNTGTDFLAVLSATSSPFDHTVNHYNNVWKRFKRTAPITNENYFIRFVSASTILNSHHNMYYSDAPNPAELQFLISFVGQDFPTYQAANEPTATFVQPGINENHKPLNSSSNVIGQGVYYANVYDSAGVAFWIPPAQGAYEYERPRPSRLFP